MKRRTLWPGVTSPLARRVLSDIFNHHANYPSPGKDLFSDLIRRTDPNGPTNAELEQYYFLIKDGLPRSSLAQLLPAGMDLLPDIYSAVPEFYRGYCRIFRPRNYGQLIEHLVMHLEWYVKPTEEYRQLSRQPSIWVWWIVAGILVVFLGLFVLMTGIQTGALLILIGISAAPIANARMGVVTPYNRLEVNASLLYRYLRDSYSDPPEDTG